MILIIAELRLPHSLVAIIRIIVAEVVELDVCWRADTVTVGFCIRRVLLIALAAWVVYWICLS